MKRIGIGLLQLGIWGLFLIHPFWAQAQPKNRYTQQTYIAAFKPLCDSLASTYKIPSEVILGVAMQESAYGNSKVCRLLNNHHGIAGKNSLLQTTGTRSRYKQFENDSASFIAFCELVKSRKYYSKLIETPQSINTWLITIGRNGYCANPSAWNKEIQTILRKNELLPK